MTMNKLPRREFLRLAGLAAAVPVMPRTAFAQAYPTRPVKLVVGFSAGGTTDLLARVLAPPLSERLGQQVIIENKPGGGTNIAIQSVINSPPDGYTLAMTFATNTINPSLYKSLPFDFQRDMAPVSGLADLPLVLVVNKDVPAKNVTEFVAYAKAKPDKVAFASFGARTISQLAIELLKNSAGFEYVHVPYPGGPQIITDLISGRVQAGMDALPNSLPHIRSGAVRALAVMSPGRNPAIPNVPAIGEIIPGLGINAGTGIGVPAKTPPEIVERLNHDINACLAEPTLKSRYADVGAVPIILTPVEARAGIASDTEKWRKVIEQAGLKPE
jgi:tripartite-type tricarboxylate transporter receptor subunit TctC